MSRRSSQSSSVSSGQLSQSIVLSRWLSRASRERLRGGNKRTDARLLHHGSVGSTAAEQHSKLSWTQMHRHMWWQSVGAQLRQKPSWMTPSSQGRKGLALAQPHSGVSPLSWRPISRYLSSLVASNTPSSALRNLSGKPFVPAMAMKFPCSNKAWIR